MRSILRLDGYAQLSCSFALKHRGSIHGTDYALDVCSLQILILSNRRQSGDVVR